MEEGRSSDENGRLDAQVLVVGAGPVGLALALELGLRGIAVIVVEQLSRAGAQPRAKTTNARTMQHMRRWGLAEKLRDAAPLPRDYPTDIAFVTKVFGRRLALIENAFAGAKVRDPRFPEAAQWMPQYIVEAVLRERLGELASVELRSGQRFAALEQLDSGVAATIEDDQTGERRTLRVSYVVGADGARSRVREAIGARMEGDHAFGLNYNVVLRIPELAVEPPTPRAIMYWVLNPQSPCVITPLHPDIWALGIMLPPGVKEVADADLLRRLDLALGRPVDAEILTRDVWAAHRLIASHYRDRRVFLAGDACHLHPPFGGYGMNLGIADAVDLGWKLAATIEGWGGPGLLDSYQIERQPLHVRTIEEAVANYRVLSEHLLKANLEDATSEGDRLRAALEQDILAAKSREFHTLGVVLGSRYATSPIIVDDDSLPPEEHHSRFEPSAHPGCLAPHAWLPDGSSLYDHLGAGYTLLRTGPAETDAIRDDAAEIGLPLTMLDLCGAGIGSLYEAPLALIRPDQHVAWRGSGLDAGVLDIVRGAQPMAIRPGSVGARPRPSPATSPSRVSP